MMKLFSNLICLFAILLAACNLYAFQAETEKDSDDQSSVAKPQTYRGEFRSVRIEEPESSQRAWETRPYEVAAWVCHDGSPLLTNNESEICQRISTECQLVDPSGWNVKVGTPPSQWRWKLLNSPSLSESEVVELLSDPELEFYDKLIIVRLSERSGNLKISVREIDSRTRQLGPTAMATTRLVGSVGPLASKLIRRAFMPIARIDEVFKNNTTEMRARGIEACVRTEINENLEPEVVSNVNSPCFVRETDRFLPVVVRTDRSGNITKLEAIPLAFVAIKDISDTLVSGVVYSSVRAPLAGRKSKRAEKLALVIRPGDGETTLRLMSRDSDDAEPLEGYDVATVNPDDIKDEWEYHGKTDWRGEIKVPKSDDMRMLLVRRGGRRLKRIPVIPGFLDVVETTVTNDETRLLASGVVNGLENEILSLAVLRQIYQKQIEAAIKEGNKDDARKILRTYTSLENPQDLKARMADEEVRLRGQTDVQREKEVIQRMFSPLKKIVSSDFIKNNETDIQKWIDAGKVPDPEPEVPAARAKPDTASQPEQPAAAKADDS